MWLIKFLSVAAILMAVSARSLDQQLPNFISSLLQKIVETNEDPKQVNLIVSPSGVINSLLPVINLSGKYHDRFEFLHSLTTNNISDPEVISYVTDSDIWHIDTWYYDEKIESKVMEHFHNIGLQPYVIEKHPLASPDGLINYVKDGGVMILGSFVFKLQWQYPFKKQLKNSGLMSGTFDIFRGVLNDENEKSAEWIELPFKNSYASMYVFTSEGSFAKLENTLAKINFNNLAGKKQNVHVTLPKIQIRSSTDMQPILEKMGLEKMFKPSTASNLHVDRFGQTTSLQISESGAEAVHYSKHSGSASFKESDVKPTPVPFESRNASFHVIGPFVYAIVDKPTGLPYLFGHYKGRV